MKVVTGCNVLVEAARTDGVCCKMIDDLVRRHEIAHSPSVLAEYETVAEQCKHATYRDTLTVGDVVMITDNSRDFMEPRYGSVEVFSPRALFGSSDTRS